MILIDVIIATSNYEIMLKFVIVLCAVFCISVALDTCNLRLFEEKLNDGLTEHNKAKENLNAIAIDFEKNAILSIRCIMSTLFFDIFIEELVAVNFNISECNAIHRDLIVRVDHVMAKSSRCMTEALSSKLEEINDASNKFKRKMFILHKHGWKAQRGDNSDHNMKSKATSSTRNTENETTQNADETTQNADKSGKLLADTKEWLNLIVTSFKEILTQKCTPGMTLDNIEVLASNTFNEVKDCIVVKMNEIQPNR